MSNSARPRKRAGRPRGVPAKTRGSPMTRRTIRRIARRILADTADHTVEEGAKRLGLVPHDIKNLRAGNLPSLQQLLRLVAKGRCCPEALIFDDEIRKLPSRTSTRQVQRRLISARIRKLASERDAASLARKTGLSIYSIYQLRVGNSPPGIHALLGFVNAGVPVSEIFFGQPAKRR